MTPSDQIGSAMNFPQYHAQPVGSPWSPEGSDSPHALDYKLNIIDEPARLELMKLIAAERQTPGSQQLSLGWFNKPDRFVSFTAGQAKRGCFVQAGCIVTDGFRSGAITRVLTAYRSEHQFHDPTVPRRTKGFSGVFATVLASFKKQDPYGHAPTALFNDIHDYCPWALFSRKLLLPDIHMDARFLGLGYNFRDPNCGYVFLLWHVRTENCPEVMQVPARQSRKHDILEHDVPEWVLSHTIQFEALADKPIDQLGLAHVLGWPIPDIGASDERGFLPFPKFADVWKQDPPRPVVIERDEVILDLLRMYQQEFHGSRRKITEDRLTTEKEKALQSDVAAYLRESCQRHRMHVRVNTEMTLGWMPRAGRADVVLEVFDQISANEEQSPQLRFRYLIECKLSKKPEKEASYLDQCKEYRASSARVRSEERSTEGFDAIVLLHAVAGPQARFALQGVITYPDEAQPIHVVRIAITPAAPSKAPTTREVVHAIIPLKTASDGVQWLLFTKNTRDANPRLPGGKVKDCETLVQAILRELHEELNLERSDVEEMIEVKPGSDRKESGFTSLGISLSTGEERLYHFHPFIVVLTEDARQRILAGLGQGDHQPKAALISEWMGDGFGHKTDYANAVVPHLNPELLSRAAIAIP